MYKKKFAILFLSFIFFSCNLSREEKDEFRDYFYYRVSEIVEYNDLVKSGNEIHLNDWMFFLENCSWLETLTGCKLGFIAMEPPYYESDNQMAIDTTNLLQWYNRNKNNWSMRKADEYVYRKRKGHTVYF